MQGRGARHTACSHPHVVPVATQRTRIDTPVSSMDTGFQASGWPALTVCDSEKNV